MYLLSWCVLILDNRVCVGEAPVHPPPCNPCNPQPPLEGFVIVSAMVRLLSDEGMTVERAVRRFADCRPPGIYKDGEEGVEPQGWKGKEGL